MGSTDKSIEQYKDFLEEKYGLGPEDLKVLIKFNQELAEDIDLLEAVERYFDHKNKSKAFHKTLGELNNKYFSEKQVTIDFPAANKEKKTPNFSLKSIGRIAAVFTLIAGSSVVFYYLAVSDLNNKPVATSNTAPKNTDEINEKTIEIESINVTTSSANNQKQSNNDLEEVVPAKQKKRAKNNRTQSKPASKERNGIDIKGLDNGRALYLKGDYLGCLNTLKEINKISEDYEEARHYMKLALGDLEQFGLLPKELENEFKQISASATNSDEKIEALTELALTSHKLLPNGNN